MDLADQRQEDLFWIRDEFLQHERDFGKVIVHGHTPVPEPDIRFNRINIDTGDYHPLFAQRGSIGYPEASQVVELADKDFATIFSAQATRAP